MTTSHKSAQAFIWALCLIAGSAFAQSSLPACQGSDVSRWTNCFGFVSYSSTEKYSGEFIDGQRHGMGTFTFFGGWKYVGEFKNYKRNGQGIYYKPDGSISAAGNWSDDKLVSSFALDTNRFPFNPPIQTASAFSTPPPIQTASAFSTPERVQLGSAAQSQLPACQGSDVSRWTNCFGTATSANGNKYVGEFKDGNYHGQGTYTFSTGNKYVGEYKDDKRNGQGTLTWANGEKYVGEFKDDKFNGQGTYTFANGHKYVGDYKDDKRNGQGTYTYANGDKYVGEYKDNQLNGEGIRYSPSGSIIEQGRWQNDRLVQSFAVDTQRFPFNSPLTASSTQAPVPDPIKAERDLLAADLDASRKNAKDLEERLAAAQALANSLPKPAAASVRNAHALVIGNAAYPGSGRLDNPVNDAKAISQKLRSMGFTVTTVNDANRQKLVQSMAQFRRTAAAADISLLFYSGHGVQIFGTNYMLPTDVDQTDPAQATIQGVSLNSVVENFLPGKTKLVFLDACRDNALQRTTDRSVSKGLAPISAAEGTLISYATKDGQTASDGVGAKNSPFTQALLQHLDDPADIAVVLRKVREKVMQATGGKQQPWEYGSLTGGELVLSKIKGGR